jgi:ABC-type dipeptide/oligopeptide/nickel transport system ATPase subunit
MPQFIYTMKGLGKVYPPDSRVLHDIWLSFLPGAKIGVLGLNGSGKSTLLRIMAGEEQSFIGEAFPADRISAGFLQQEPVLDSAKTVLGVVEEGVAEVRGLLQRFDEINAKFGEDLSPDEMEKVLEEQGRVQDRIEAAGAWELDSKLELAMDALRLPPPDTNVATLSGGERRGGHSRSLLPRQRRRLDPRAGSRVGYPVGGELLVVAGAEAEAPRGRGEAGDEAAALARSRARMGADGAARPPGQGEGEAPRV